MISARENDLLTNISPKSPTGELLRRYWQPAALLEEFAGDRPIIPVTLMGEHLVLFRDESGRYGLIERHCPHRGADLCFGRLEHGGIRCAFHGWLFDVMGNYLEQPAEPEGSTFYQRLKHVAYPCEIRNGIVFAYLGPGDPPPFPDFDCYTAPEEDTFAFKGLWECNWLQAFEVGIDPAHASFLHRFFEDEDTNDSYGKQFRAGAASTDVPLTKILREYERPEINTEDTDYGFRIITTRDLEDDKKHYRITNMVFPNAIAIPMSHEMMITQWHVPIDNETCYWYSIFTSYAGPVDKDLMRQQRIEQHTLPEYRPIKNKSNSYGFNIDEQKGKTYTGMGMDINVHDQWAVESLGSIQDRTKEHLGKSDVAITKYRRILKTAIKAIDENKNPPYLEIENETTNTKGPIAIDAIGPADDDNFWKKFDLKRRESVPWSTDPSKS